MRSKHHIQYLGKQHILYLKNSINYNTQCYVQQYMKQRVSILIHFTPFATSWYSCPDLFSETAILLDLIRIFISIQSKWYLKITMICVIWEGIHKFCLWWLQILVSIIFCGFFFISIYSQFLFIFYHLDISQYRFVWKFIPNNYNHYFKYM